MKKESSTVLLIVFLVIACSSSFLLAPVEAGSGSNKVGPITVGPQSPAPINPSETASYQVTIDRDIGPGSFTVDITALNLPDGASFQPLSLVFTSSDTSKTGTLFIVTDSTISPGEYFFTIKASRSDNAGDFETTIPLSISLLVAPEYVLGGLLALGACFAGFVVYKKRSSFTNFKQL